jgi:hypothetical protein
MSGCFDFEQNGSVTAYEMIVLMRVLETQIYHTFKCHAQF